MNNLITITQDVQVNIENRIQTVSVSVECHPKMDQSYFLSAVTECGFELCGGNQGYFKYHAKRTNPRLRSEKSIANDMLATLDSLILGIQDIASGIILTERVVKGSIHGTEVYINGVVGVPFMPASNIHSKQSGQALSWYTHDVFTQGTIELTVFRNSDGYLRFKADENALYDKAKLQELHDSDAFQNSKLAFFFYNECRRLLGIPVMGEPARMSGLFAQGIQE